MNQNHSDALVIKLRPASSAHHLQDICDWEVYVSSCLAIVIFSTFDYDQVSREIHSPCQRTRGYQDLEIEETMDLSPYN